MGFELATSSLFSLNILYFQYGRFFLDKEKFLENFFPELRNPSINGRDLQIWRLWSGIKFKFFEMPKRLFPYLWFNIGIGGLVRNEAKIKTFDSVLTIYSSSETDLSMQFGVGLEYSLSNILAVNLSSHYTTGSGFNFEDNIGSVNYFDLNLGMVITLAKNCVLPNFPGIK